MCTCSSNGTNQCVHVVAELALHYVVSLLVNAEVWVPFPPLLYFVFHFLLCVFDFFKANNYIVMI